MAVNKSRHSLRHSPSFTFRSLFVKLLMWANLTCVQLILTDVIGICCESSSHLPLRQKRHCEQVQFCWYLCRSLPWNFYHLYTSSARCVWRIVSPVAPLLAYSYRIWFPHASVGFVEGNHTQEINRALEGQGYQRSYDV